MIIGITGHRALRSDEPRAIAIATAALSVWQPDAVVTGLALGWDTAVAHAALALGIPFRAFTPGEWQPDRWPPHAQERYRYLLERAAEVRSLPGPYSTAALHVRNMDIVNASDMMLAMWDGKHMGGTWGAIEYATRRKAVPTPVVNLWPLWVTPCHA